MTNCLNPDFFTPRERLDEVAGILALGIIRLELKDAKKDNISRNLSPNSLDVSCVQSLNDPDQRSPKPRNIGASRKGD